MGEKNETQQFRLRVILINTKLVFALGDVSIFSTLTHRAGETDKQVLLPTIVLITGVLPKDTRHEKK